MSFKRLDQEDITLSAESTVAPVWSGNAYNLSTPVISSTQVNLTSGKYYYNIYDTDPTTSASASVQYSITFGHKYGKGSTAYNSAVPGLSPSSTIYGQYRNLVFGDEGTDFVFGNYPSDYFYAITVNRARYKEKLLPGSFNLIISGSGSSRLSLTDNSLQAAPLQYVDAGRVYEIVSGSNGTPYSGSGYSATSGSYGKFLPDVGIILLNGKALDQPFVSGGISLGTEMSSSGQNLEKLYDAIKLGGKFELRSEETITSNYLFVRVRNSEFNYSTNPSNITGSGELLHDNMINNPQAYITTVGMYNDNNDLLAVAKLSRPLLKDFTKEALIRIKIDY